MIHHISISASNPLHVAEVLAELLDGCAAPFPPHPGSYMALALDEHGTLIEVYPAGTELLPGVDREQATFSTNAFAYSFGAVHAAISVPVSEEKIQEVAQREGWRSLHCCRDGFFEVIELWIENTLMIELLPPAIAHQYLEFVQPENLKQMLSAAPVLA
ncbi:hypothetical protein [Scytonema sp. PRP1]|uniref:hypothetical protein n=1 Tax=Scytonema sp. PRP1 TaxID=3120513 RepID=UPI00300D2F1B